MVTLMVGQKVSGRYQILQQLGKGAFGVTFLAEDMQRPGNPQCVVKHFEPMATDPFTLRQGRRFFDQEAEMLEQLGKHEQIPRLLAHIEENQEFYLVQEYIEGHDLSAELLPQGKKLSEAYVIKLLQDILEILTFVHSHGVIHRDIKPSNVRRRRDGKIVLIDFGAVKQISTQVVNSQGQTSFNVAIGTHGYMPCEQSDRNPQFNSDIYAVGMIGIQALTGIPPINLPKDSQTGEIVWRNQAKVSCELADILDKMVRYHFVSRYQSATDTLSAFGTLPNNNTKPPQNQPTLNHNPGTATTPRFNWKYLIPLPIVAAIATIFLLSQPPKSPTPENFLTYENPGEKIKMKYPQSWERQDINNRITGEVATFISPKQNDADKFQEKLIISVENFSGTLEDFGNTSENEIKNYLASAEIQEQSYTTLANKSANKLVYTGKDGENNLKNLQISTLKNNQAYVITYTAAIDNYNDFIQTAETMIKSVEIQ